MWSNHTLKFNQPGNEWNTSRCCNIDKHKDTLGKRRDFLPGDASDKEPACQCRRCKRCVRMMHQEDPLEEGTATLSSFLAWRIPGQRNLVGYSPLGHTESDMTEATEQACKWKKPDTKDHTLYHCIYMKYLHTRGKFIETGKEWKVHGRWRRGRKMESNLWKVIAATLVHTWISQMPLSFTLTSGWKGKFYVMYTLPSKTDFGNCDVLTQGIWNQNFWIWILILQAV